MTRTPRLRRPASLVAAVSAAALLGALLPVALAPTAAVAANGCLTEVETGQGPLGPLTPGTRCDDQVPPTATLDSVSPAPNEAGFVNSDALTFTFSGAHSDGDTDPIGFECQFFSTAAEPAGWDSCTSPATYDELPDTTSVPYTFRVRAFDAADRTIDATQPTDPLFGTGGADTDLFNTPFDAETPQLPMLTTDSPTFRLAASEGNVDYTCDIEGRSFPCENGNTTFKELEAGTRTLTVGATDPAGNVDPDPATTRFTVPEDIERPEGRDWREAATRKAFGGSYIETDRFGAKFSVSGVNVREVRLICTTRPGAGILRYKVPGNPNWAKAKMNSKTIQRQAVVTLRNPSSKSFTGKMRFKVMSRGKLVAVDAIMLR